MRCEALKYGVYQGRTVTCRAYSFPESYEGGETRTQQGQVETMTAARLQMIP